jgi:hypothetical protein
MFVRYSGLVTRFWAYLLFRASGKWECSENTVIEIPIHDPLSPLYVTIGGIMVGNLKRIL